MGPFLGILLAIAVVAAGPVALVVGLWNVVLPRRERGFLSTRTDGVILAAAGVSVIALLLTFTEFAGNLAEQQEAELMRDPAYRAEKQERARERVEKAKRERIASHCKKDSIRSTAYVKARDFVTDRLKAPSTAEFPYGSGYSVSFVGECSFVVTGYVDSQNGFGAMIRTPWVVKLTRDLQKADYWKLDDIAFVQ